jgi:predicted esterase
MPRSSPTAPPPGARPLIRTRSTVPWLIALLLGASPGVQEAHARQGVPAVAADPALATSLLRVEFAIRDRPPEPDAWAGLNRAFDQATFLFFAGQVDPVVAAMDALVTRIEPDAGRRAEHEEEARSAVGRTLERGEVLEGSRGPIAVRIHGPASPGPDPLPVIVALHGAGGNEHMFVEAYGAGRLAALAEERGFVLVSPATPSVAADPEALGRILDFAARSYPLDRSRVHLVGHSMGAAAAWSLALRSPGEIASVACLAGVCGGGSAPSGAPLPSLLVIAGGLDPIIPPERIGAAVQAAEAAGRSVTYRVEEDQGHTLIVGYVIDSVVDWLLRPGGDR